MNTKLNTLKTYTLAALLLGLMMGMGGRVRANPKLMISPYSVPIGIPTPITLTGSGTTWSSSHPVFASTETGLTLSSIVYTSDTTATATATATSPGTGTITDPSNGNAAVSISALPPTLVPLVTGGAVWTPLYQSSFSTSSTASPIGDGWLDPYSKWTQHDGIADGFGPKEEPLYRIVPPGNVRITATFRVTGNSQTFGAYAGGNYGPGSFPALSAAFPATGVPGTAQSALGGSGTFHAGATALLFNATFPNGVLYTMTLVQLAPGAAHVTCTWADTASPSVLQAEVQADVYNSTAYNTATGNIVSIPAYAAQVNSVSISTAPVIVDTDTQALKLRSGGLFADVCQSAMETMAPPAGVLTSGATFLSKPYKAQYGVTGPRVVFANGSGAVNTYACSLLVNGTLYPCLFDGQHTAQNTGARYSISDAATDLSGNPLHLAAGTSFQVLYYTQGAMWGNTFTYVASQSNVASGGGDVTLSVPVSGMGSLATNGSYGPEPTALFGTVDDPTLPTAVVFGDSIAAGQGDNRFGFVANALVAGGIPCLNLAYPGEGIGQLPARNGFSRTLLAALANNAIDEYGFNDLQAGSSASTMEAAILANYNDPYLAHLPIWKTTLMPRVNLTDSGDASGLNTLTDQTPNGAQFAVGGTEVSVNGWIRSLTTAQLHGGGVFDVADAVMTGRNSQIWKAGSVINGDVHPWPPGHDYASVAIMTTLLRKANVAPVSALPISTTRQPSRGR